MSTLQTAQALDPGKQRILVGGGYYASPSVNETASTTANDVSLALPYMEVGYRRGIVENLELGAKVTIPGTVGLDAKYQLVKAGDFAVAAGLGGSYLSISSTSNNMTTSTKLVDAIVPIYVSYDIAKPFAVYASPKYVARFAQSTDENGMMTSGMENLVGATLGTRLGSRFGLFLETSYLKDLSSTFDSFQVNGSIFF